jgi:GT2 family glycosyltransferase
LVPDDAAGTPLVKRESGCSVSVVIVAFRQREALVAALRSASAAAARVPGGAEVIVVDNGGLADLVRASAPEARLIEPGTNIGFAGAVNRAIAVANGRWVALLNDDASLDEEALAVALSAGERDPKIGSVAGQVRFEAAPGVINCAGIAVDSLGVAVERLAGRPVADAATGGEVFGATGCFALYRSEMLERVGGFEQRFFAYLEDVDLAWRAAAGGWRAVYEPGAVAFHRGSASSGEGSRLKYWLGGRNRVWLLARNATGAQLRRALLGILLYDGAYIAYAAVADRTLAPLQGRLTGLRSWRAMRRERDAERATVTLSPAAAGWAQSARMHRAYRGFGGRAHRAPPTS